MVDLTLRSAGSPLTNDQVDDNFRNLNKAANSFAVLDKDLTAPPGSPSVGDSYLVAAGATGAWSGQSGKYAEYFDGAWEFLTIASCFLYVADEDKLYVINSSGAISTTAVQAYDAYTAKLNLEQRYSGAAKGIRETLGNQSSSITWHMSQGYYGFTATLTGNAAINNPTNKPSMSTGDILSGLITLTQDGTGSRVPSWGSDFKNTPTLSTTANAVDHIPFVYDGTYFILGAKVAI